MPQNKKHHYVPRFYLKRFSEDGKSINLWNIKKEQKIETASLKNQCYKNYFYGKDLQFEHALDSVEGQVASLFQNVDRHNVLPRLGSPEHFSLIVYILIQYGRTEYSTEALDEMSDKLAKHLLRPVAEKHNFDISRVTIGIKDVSQQSLGFLVPNYPLLLDLHCKLLLNKTNEEFITSDNPVVFYNHFLSFRTLGSNTGLASKGLQIFLPIGPSNSLVLYDRDVYSLGKSASPVVDIHSPQDIYELNTLQYCSALNNIYFRNSKQDIAALHRKGSKYRRAHKTSFDAFPAHAVPHKTSEFIATSRVDIRTDLRLSFLRTTSSAKKWRERFRKKRYQPVAVLRNERWHALYEEFMGRVKAGEYQGSEFYPFLHDKVQSSRNH